MITKIIMQYDPFIRTRTISLYNGMLLPLAFFFCFVGVGIFFIFDDGTGLFALSFKSLVVSFGVTLETSLMVSV